jgi:hypothetical protein
MSLVSIARTTTKTGLLQSQGICVKILAPVVDWSVEIAFDRSISIQNIWEAARSNILKMQDDAYDGKKAGARLFRGCTAQYV